MGSPAPLRRSIWPAIPRRLRDRSGRPIHPRFPPQRTLSMRKVLSGLVPLVALLAAGWLIARDRQGRLLWDHWDEVKRGILYRSGQLTADQLAEAVKRYQLRTVI